MIILQTLEGREHQLQAGDRLVIQTDHRTVAFTTASGNPLLPVGGGDSKIIIPSFYEVTDSHQMAAFVSTIAGLSFTRDPDLGNTIHRYVFMDKP